MGEIREYLYNELVGQVQQGHDGNRRDVCVITVTKRYSHTNNQYSFIVIESNKRNTI